MADKTGISWTDHTFNPWWGCTKIAAGCDNCYAAELDNRTGGNYWEPKSKPRRTKPNNWGKARTWNRKAEKEGVRRRVFCGSMMDWCDKDAPEGAIDDLWQLIRETPMLDWQLLTKRATLIKKRLPDDWGEGYPNVWLGVTVEDTSYGFARIEAFREIPAIVKFLSCEPLLEDVSIGIDLSDIDWVIIGGESGGKARSMDSEWASSLNGKCAILGIPVWFKQIGGRGRDKGGDKLNGAVIKFWPSTSRRSRR